MADKQDDETQEAAEILTDLLANQGSIAPKPSNGNTQVGDAQKAALQQLVAHGGGGNVLNEKSVRALLDAMGGAEEGGGGEKRHVFWDTQVSSLCGLSCVWLWCKFKLYYYVHLVTDDALLLLYLM
jgi:hypothetical protein